MLANLHREYIDLIPFAPEDLARRVNRLITPIDINSFRETEPTAREVVDIWFAALNNGSNKDSFAWVFVTLLIKGVLSVGHPLNPSIASELSRRSSLAGKAMSVVATRFEATRRLAANLYHIGRLGTPTEDKQRVLLAAVSLFDFLIKNDRGVTRPTIGMKYFGMRGVARVLLARTAETKYEAYTAACSDLQESRRLGNNGVEASYYLIESKIHLYDLGKDQRYLTDAEQILRDVNAIDCNNRLLWFGSGEVSLRKGFAMLESGQKDLALGNFEHALDCLRKADLCPPDTRLAADFLSMKRGHAALKAYTCRYELGLSNGPTLLDAAIVDLRFGGASLPAALILRSIVRRNDRHYEEARADLNEALLAINGAAEVSPYDDKNRSQCRAGLVECAIQLGLERQDPPAVFEGCEQSLQLPNNSREVNIGAVIYGARFLLDTDGIRYADQARRIAYNIRSRMTALQLLGDEYQFAASHASRLLVRSCQVLADEHSLRMAYELSSTAISQNTGAPPELHATAGEAALRLGRLVLRKGKADEASELFLDAGERFEAAVATAEGQGASEAFSLQVAHSKAGEAYMRAHAFSGSMAQAEKARFHLTISRQLGNTAVELLGMLGDVSYRQGRRTRDIEQLRLALKFKEEARSRGTVSRENRSVSAAAAFVLWQTGGEISDLSAAIQTAIEAVEVDSTWPWPLFQLSEMAALNSDVRRAATEPLLRSSLQPELVRSVRSGDVEEIIRHGCRLAIATQEFTRDEFGSRQPVYVLDDPHNLLKQTVVFKETYADIADRERENVENFWKYLAQVGAPASLKLPEPLLTHAVGEKVVYVMRRARGIQLGKACLIPEWRVRASRAYEQAIQFLAHYHAWRLGHAFPVHLSPQVANRMVANTFRFWRLANFKSSEVIQLAKECLSLLLPSLPCIPKKDAHPENWLVDDEENVVMLDLESTGHCPLLFEVVQLLDDYPFLPVNDVGWAQRLSYCALYLDRLRTAGIDVERYRAMIPDAYAVFALFRISFGLARNKTRRMKIASSAVHAGDLRDKHYLSILDYLAQAHSRRVGTLATKIRRAVSG